MCLKVKSKKLISTTDSAGSIVENIMKIVDVFTVNIWIHINLDCRLRPKNLFYSNIIITILFSVTIGNPQART